MYAPNKDVFTILTDPLLDKYDEVILFPDKLAKSNKNLKKSGFPKLSEKIKLLIKYL